MKKREFTISLEQKGQRLDHFLAFELIDISRSQIKKMILAGNVLLNGNQPAVHQFLKEGDVVVADLSFFEKEKVVMNIDLDVVYEHEDFIIINKPSGLIVHEFEGIKETSLAELVVKKYPEIKDVGEDPQRPGIVHRLDKDVSGLMVVARNQKAFLWLKSQFQGRLVHKEYFALVHGSFDKYNGKISFRIKRSQSQKHKMAALPEQSEEGKEALSHYQVIREYGSKTLVNVRIETGRTHQIRVHMNAIDRPVVGDSIYNQSKHSSKINRVFLHSHKLSFKNHDGVEYEFVSYLPIKLKKYLYTLVKYNKLFVLSGPSGVGKTTLLKEFFKKRSDSFGPTTTYTTREKRKDAVEDKILKYTTKEEFQKMIEANQFVEWAEVFGNYYGTHKATLESSLKDKNVIANIDVQGMHLIMNHFPEAITVFVSLHNIDYLKKRIESRGKMTAEELEKRLNEAHIELSNAPVYDYIVYNDQDKQKDAYQDLDSFLAKNAE